MNNLSIWSLAWLLVSCVTTHPKPLDSTRVPATVASLYSVCQNEEGTMKLVVRHKNQPTVTTDLDWLSDSTKMIFDFVDPLGNTLSNLTYTKADKKISVRNLALVANFDVDDLGFLEVDSYRLPIKLEELGCLFAGKMPYAWSGDIYQLDQKQNLLIMYGYSDQRQREHTITFESNGSLRLCSRLSVSSFFGLMERAIVICNYDRDLRSGSLGYKDSFSLQWTDLRD